MQRIYNFFSISTNEVLIYFKISFISTCYKTFSLNDCHNIVSDAQRQLRFFVHANATSDNHQFSLSYTLLMNLKRILFGIILSTVPVAAFCDADIIGKVINKATNEPMDFVNVQLLEPAGGKQLPIGASTDEAGNFIIDNVKSGKYIIRISNIGSVDVERDVVVDNSVVNVGTIKLADDSKMLQEVVVEGIRSQMRFELDKKVFTVDANIAASGTSASELLESIPSVEVDQDGEVSLRGNSSVTVWINGKESGLTADNRAQILEQIPAETIERVEVITNPSAKYSPEGTAGIINIVLKKDRKAGYFGSAEVGANSRGGGNASFNFNLNSSKWEAFASVGFRMRHNKGGSELRRTFNDATFLNSDATTNNHGNNLFLRLGATYHATSKDAIWINGFGMFGYRWSNSLNRYQSNIPSTWFENDEYTHTKSRNRGAHGELGYTHKWSDTQTIDVSLGYNYWGGPNNNSYLYDEHWLIDSETVIKDKFQQQHQEIGVKSWEAKVDYSNTFNQYLKLEAGFNGNYNFEDTPVTTFEGTSAANAILIPDFYNRFIYHNNISALYFTLGGKAGKLSYSAGLRGEAWQVRTKSLGYEQPADSKDWYKYNNFALFPSAFISYSLPKDNELQINYTRRIRRPWGGQLNSFVDLREASEVQYGNPELQPEYANAFELNYIKSWTFHMISASAYLRTADNVMNRLSYIENDVMYSTFANVSNTLNAGMEIVAKNSLFHQHLDLTTTLNLYNNHISAWQLDMPTISGQTAHLSGKSRNSFAWDIRMMASVRLPWALSFQATGRYRSKELSAQGSKQGGWSVDAGLRRAFGNWSVSINCRDIFDSRKFRNTIDGIDYIQTSKRWRGGRRFQLTVKYSFGNMKAKPQRNIEPTDASGYGAEEM